MTKGERATSQHVTMPLKWFSSSPHGVNCAGKPFGGKGAFNGKLAKWIISLMPKHVHYVEPFAGGLAVLLHKDPEVVSEVVNDLHSGLTTFWRVLADERSFEMMRRRLELTAFSEDEFDRASERLNQQSHTVFAHDIAADFFIVCRQSRQGLMKDFATMSRTRVRRGMNEQVSSWLTAVEGLADVHERLKRVVVMRRDGIDVIKSQDGEDTLFYVDCPYLHETRSSKSDYEFEMTREQHIELLTTLAEIDGKFILSGYRSELYEHSAKLYGWRVAEFDIVNNASSKATKEKKTEVCWTNYDLE